MARVHKQISCNAYLLVWRFWKEIRLRYFKPLNYIVTGSLMPWALSEHMAEKYLVENFIASINPQRGESHLPSWTMAKDASGLPVLVWDRWKGWGQPHYFLFIVPLRAWITSPSLAPRLPRPSVPSSQQKWQRGLVTQGQASISGVRPMDCPEKSAFLVLVSFILKQLKRIQIINKWVECGGFDLL